MDDATFISKLEPLWAVVSGHIGDCDTHDLFRLEECLSTVDSEKLGDDYCHSKTLASTRSHLDRTPLQSR